MLSDGRVRTRCHPNPVSSLYIQGGERPSDGSVRPRCHHYPVSSPPLSPAPLPLPSRHRTPHILRVEMIIVMQRQVSVWGRGEEECSVCDMRLGHPGPADRAGIRDWIGPVTNGVFIKQNISGSGRDRMKA